MRPYPSYSPFNAGWIERLPSHWEAIPVKFVCTYNDEALPETTDPEALIEYVEISDVDEINGLRRSELMTFGSAPSRARRIARNGDVLISTVRTYLRAVAPVIDPPDNLVVSTGFAVVRPERLTAGFARYALIADGFVGSVIARSTGVSYPAINASDLVRIPLPVPPDQEQAAITAYLDVETSRIDALIAEKQALIRSVNDLEQSAGFELATRGLDSSVRTRPSGIEWLPRVPAHWPVKRNMFLFHQRNEAGVEGLPILMVSLHTGVSEGEDEDEGSARVRKRMEDKSSYQIARRGDVAYNMMRAWQGAIGAVPVDGLVSPAYVVLEPTEDLDPRYFEILARTPGYIKEFERYSYGIASFRWRLYWEGFKEIRTPVPPIQEQRAIVAAFDEKRRQITALRAHVERELSLLVELRAATITDAVLGRIDVRGYTNKTAQEAA